MSALAQMIVMQTLFVSIQQDLTLVCVRQDILGMDLLATVSQLLSTGFYAEIANIEVRESTSFQTCNVC